MYQVELSGVGKSFGSVDVIHNIDLQVGQGELVVFVGPSGCGKSTLLRMICGLEHLNRGEIRIDGRSMRGVDPARREVAMVFQSYALYPHMNVADNMGFALRMAGMSKRERAQRVRDAARILRLEDLLDRLPKQLSGGQRQRVAIGRAIVRNPKVFLFDEPLSNLDAELRVQMRFEIAALHRELGATMIYVTHDQVEAMTMADRIVVLRGGRIEQIGAPNDLYARPDNLFVAGFIGSPRMNFLKCKVLRTTGGSAELALAGPEQPPFSMDVEPGRLEAGEDVTLGVRSEHVVLGAEAGIELDVDVAFVENLGGTAYLHAPDHPAGSLIFECRDENARAGTGRRRVGIDPRRCHLFDRNGLAVARR
jgi:lactose/L-arabinose transport system ATP-binding protein